MQLSLASLTVYEAMRCLFCTTLEFMKLCLIFFLQGLTVHEVIPPLLLYSLTFPADSFYRVNIASKLYRELSALI